MWRTQGWSGGAILGTSEFLRPPKFILSIE
jgi:hypothetical protein